mgnify:CR=1 FL=1
MLTRAINGGFDGGDVDLSHLHHGFESPFRGRLVLAGDCVEQALRGDLPR